MKTEIILIRHGQTDANINRVIAGRCKAELTDKGIEQAKCVAKALKNEKIDALYSSGLKRANDTISYLAKEKGMSVEIDEGFMELSYGIYDGRKLTEFVNAEGKICEEKLIEYYLTTSPEFEFTGGERLKDAVRRFTDAIKRVAKKNAGKRIAVATHSDILNWVIPYLKDKNEDKYVKKADGSVHNCSFTTVLCDGESIELVSVDDILHIPSELLSR